MKTLVELVFIAAWILVVTIILGGIASQTSCGFDKCFAGWYLLWVLIAGYGGGFVMTHFFED